MRKVVDNKNLILNSISPRSYSAYCGKKGQIWVETVIYTLIGLAIIGIVMAAALPKIEDKKCEIVIDQSIEALINIDDKIYEVQRAAGNRRVIDLDVKKGSLIVDNDQDEISWTMDCSFPYSEEGIPINLGRVTVTTERGDPWEINLNMNYSMDLRYDNGTTGVKHLEVAPTPYKLMIENAGKYNNDIVIYMTDN